MTPVPELGLGLVFPDFRCVETLELLDQRFLEALRRHNTTVHERLLAYRKGAEYAP
ncbi:MAG: hypothetical protein ACYDB1_06695 [Acidiferrobacteraceae bacterium]